MITLFIHPQAILGVYDFLLSAKHNRSYIKKYPGSSMLGVNRDFEAKKKCIHPS